MGDRSRGHCHRTREQGARDLDTRRPGDAPHTPDKAGDVVRVVDAHGLAVVHLVPAPRDELFLRSGPVQEDEQHVAQKLRRASEMKRAEIALHDS